MPALSRQPTGGPRCPPLSVPLPPRRLRRRVLRRRQQGQHIPLDGVQLADPRRGGVRPAVAGVVGRLSALGDASAAALAGLLRSKADPGYTAISAWGRTRCGLLVWLGCRRVRCEVPDIPAYVAAE
jgi:hypothetical protein